MMIVRALGALLTYPDARLMAAVPEIRALVNESDRLPKRERDALVRFADALAGGDPYQIQEDYVACFDRGRATSLHLFEHVHGDSRERGQAMIDLRDQYLRAGLAMNQGELPDYLPAFLEYAGHLPKREALAQLTDVMHLLQSIHIGLARRRSPYSAALAALIVLAGEKPALPKQEAMPIAGPQPGESNAELDAEWAEQPAFAPARPGACNDALGPIGGGGIQPLHFIPNATQVQSGAAP